MPLLVNQWGFNTINSTEFSLSLVGNEPNSNWELVSLSVDGGPDISDQFVGITNIPSPAWLVSGSPFGTHDNMGNGHWNLTMSPANALAGSGSITMQIYAADTAGVFSTGTINFSYVVPMRTMMRLVSSSSNTRLRLISR